MSGPAWVATPWPNARAGFGVVAIDASPTGLGQLAHAARTEGLGVDTAIAPVFLAETRFEVLSIVDVDQEPPAGWHWVVLAETAPARPA